MSGVKSVAVMAFGISIGVVTPAVLADDNGSKAGMMDKHFVSEALKGGMAEVQMGQIAAQKGNSSDVKKFGQKMVDDHTMMGDQMKKVAGQVGVTPPTSPTMMQQMEIKKLNGLSGDQFDQEYIKAMVKDHEEDLNDFNKEAKSGDSDVVKNAATKGSKMISEHLSMIKQIAQAHGVQSK